MLSGRGNGGNAVPGPLDGIRIVDVSAILSGPLATMMLADQGADVIKVEPPGIGDFMRMSPWSRGGLGAFFVNGNRGKETEVRARGAAAKGLSKKTFQHLAKS